MITDCLYPNCTFLLLCSLRNIVGPLRLTMSDVSPDLNKLVRTFRSVQICLKDGRFILSKHLLMLYFFLVFFYFLFIIEITNEIYYLYEYYIHYIKPVLK